MTSSINTPDELDADKSAEVFLRIARTADSLASERKSEGRTFHEELELWLDAERLVLGKVA